MSSSNVFRNVGGRSDRAGPPARWSFFAVCCLLALVIAAGVVFSVYQWRHRASARPHERITLGLHQTENGALVYIASDLGLFAKYGLDVTVKEYEAGYPTMSDIDNGAIDVAGIPEFTLASHGFQRNDLRAFTAISVSNNIQLIARRDRGIEIPQDLKGKTIGVFRGTTTQFFLDTFLAFSGILPSEVRIVKLGTETERGLLKNDVDAAMLTEPYANNVKKKLGKNAIAWDGQSGQDYYFLLASTSGFIEEHPGGIERLLKALLDAEKFVEADPAGAKRIVQRHLRQDDDYMTWIWDRTRPSVCLTQDLLIRMEDEGRWYRKKKGSETMPNYYAYMYLDALLKVDREAVSVIH